MKYLRAIFANYFFFIISTVLFLVVTSLAIRTMGDEFFGLFSILNAIILFSGVGTLGMSSVVNKFASEKGDKQIAISTIFSTSTIILMPMALLSSGVLISLKGLIATKISTDIFIQNQFNRALVFTALSLFPQFLSRIPYGYLLSQLRNKTARLIDLLTNMAFWVGSILIAVFDKNLILIALWGGIVQLGSLCVLFFTTKNQNLWRFSFDLKAFKKIFHFSAFSFIEMLAIMLFQQFDRILVGITLGPTAAGVYSVGTSVGGKVSTVAGQATDIMIPFTSLKVSIEDRAEVYLVYRKLSKAIGLLIGLLGSLLVIWMPEILSLWISPLYSENYSNVFKIIVIAYSALCLSRPAHQTLTGMGRVNFTSITYLIISLTMLVLVYILAPLFGLIGASLANLCMIFLLVFNLYIYKLNNSHIRWKDLLADVAWGLCLPVLAYIIGTDINYIGIRLIFSLLFLAIVILNFVFDQFFIQQIRRIVKHFNLRPV